MNTGIKTSGFLYASAIGAIVNIKTQPGCSLLQFIPFRFVLLMRILSAVRYYPIGNGITNTFEDIGLASCSNV